MGEGDKMAIEFSQGSKSLALGSDNKWAEGQPTIRDSEHVRVVSGMSAHLLTASRRVAGRTQGTLRICEERTEHIPVPMSPLFRHA